MYPVQPFLLLTIAGNMVIFNAMTVFIDNNLINRWIYYSYHESNEFHMSVRSEFIVFPIRFILTIEKAKDMGWCPTLGAAVIIWKANRFLVVQMTLIMAAILTILFTPLHVFLYVIVMRARDACARAADEKY